MYSYAEKSKTVQRQSDNKVSKAEDKKFVQNRASSGTKDISHTGNISLQMQHDNNLAPADATRVEKKIPKYELENPAKLYLFADIDKKELGFSDLMNGYVGHTWVSLQYKNPKEVPANVNANHKSLLHNEGKYADPMGFWPAVSYEPNPFNSWVAGKLKHPDRAHEGNEKATESWDINNYALGKVIDYAESKRNMLYSVYDYNCTTFAKGAVEASGKNAPGMSNWGICFPNAVYEGIKKRQELGIGQTSVKDFDTGKETTVSGTNSESKKN